MNLIIFLIRDIKKLFSPWQREKEMYKKKMRGKNMQDRWRWSINIIRVAEVENKNND